MRILWLTPYIPLPLFGGGTRVFNLMKALAPTCDIDLIAGANDWPLDQPALDNLRSFCHTMQIAPLAISSSRHKRMLQLRSTFSLSPSQYWMLHSPQMQNRIDQARAQTHYDVVIVEHSFMGYYAFPVGIPMVLDQHNVESEILRRAGKLERTALRRIYNSLEYWKYLPDERRICRAADLILAASEPDRAIMQTWGGMADCTVIPNGVDSTYFVPVENGINRVEPHSIVFTGSMHYSPNVEAILFFCSEIWPRIQQDVPLATMKIVGGNPPAEIQQLRQVSNITVTGYVPDVRPYLASAQVVVAPLRIGGGTRLKILEAMAMGKAVVSTSLGCEGLEVQAGRHLVVADKPAEFASQVIGLFRDQVRLSDLGREGRRLVTESYDWTVLGSRMEEAIYALVAQLERSATG